tara:strand:+ start:858 stop:1499 length:642 start_codon:yes stop_codon:yes gene_type:complete
MTNILLEKLEKQRPNADWITKQSCIPYLSLQIDVPVKDIMREWNNIKDMAVEHRDSDTLLDFKNKGWKSLTLFGAGATITTESDAEYDWTEIQNKCVVTKEWFEHTFTRENLHGRIRFMLLEPGGHILPHKDRESIGLSEVNIAINNPDGCSFHMENRGIVPFTEGSVVMLDLSNRHWVVNNSNQPRLHMIYHGKVPGEIIERSYENLYYTNK